MLAFSVEITSGFKRNLKSCIKKYSDAGILHKKVLVILSSDPYNKSQAYKIKKLTDVSAGDGQWRIRLGSYRIRYDIIGNTVLLYSFKNRKDAYR